MRARGVRIIPHQGAGAVIGETGQSQLALQSCTRAGIQGQSKELEESSENLSSQLGRQPPTSQCPDEFMQQKTGRPFEKTGEILPPR